VFRSFISALFLLITLLVHSAPKAQNVSIAVVQGEQLGQLVQRYVVPGTARQHFDEIATLNQLVPPYILRPGSLIQIPLRLLAVEAVPAQISVVSGDVKLKKNGQNTSPAKVGDTLSEGDIVVVGSNGSAILLLADASQVQLLANSELQLVEHRYFVRLKGKSPSQAFAGLLRLLQGSIEARATKAHDRAVPLRIQTPTSVVGVRGTEFRVSTQASVQATTRTEILEGAVRAQLDPIRFAGVAGGFGVALDPSVLTVPVPVRLLDAPDLSAWTDRHDRATLEFAALPTALTAASSELKPVTGYRVQAAANEQGHTNVTPTSLSTIVFDKVFPSGTPIHIQNVPDGSYFVRVRGIDKQGLEGFSTTISTSLRTRAAPPMLIVPASRKSAQHDAIPLQWAASAASATSTYVVQVVNAQGVATLHETTAPNLTLRDLPSGTYRWRVAVQSFIPRTNVKENGIWSDYAAFDIVSVPPQPSADISQTPTPTLSWRWQAQPAARYEVQQSKTSRFEDHAQETTRYVVDQARLVVSNVAVGQHFFRYRVIESDGFVGSWSAVVKAEVTPDWKMLLIYLGGGVSVWP
jgi:hypothetical protein